MRALLFRTYLYYWFRRLSSMSRREAWDYARHFDPREYDEPDFWGAREVVEDDMDYWEPA